MTDKELLAALDARLQEIRVAKELFAALDARLQEIHATASVPYKATGKMACITALSQECLDLIDDERARTGIG